ncbi:MAG: uracil phosphoribosyltransferase [Proteocatella sp.]
MSKVVIFDHPLIQHKLTMMRDKNTGSLAFRELVKEVGTLMVYEITRDLPLADVEIETPVTKMTGKVIAGKKLAIVPILRAGLGMVEGILELIPAAKVGHIGLYRDPVTHKPVEYFCKLPQDLADRDILVVDPMLATGGSASAAIDMLKDKGAKKIILICLVGCPEGVAFIQKHHPDVDIYLAACDEKLDENCYIVPGLGDAGDRIFGTK